MWANGHLLFVLVDYCRHRSHWQDALVERSARLADRQLVAFGAVEPNLLLVGLEWGKLGVMTTSPMLPTSGDGQRLFVVASELCRHLVAAAVAVGAEATPVADPPSAATANDSEAAADRYPLLARELLDANPRKTLQPERSQELTLLVR